MDKNEQRICRYSSLLIVLTINLPKLLALREDGIAAHYWHFNLGELIFQVVLNLGFCRLLFYINLKRNFSFVGYLAGKNQLKYVAVNGILFLTYAFLAGLLQLYIFNDSQLPKIYWLAYFVRYGLSSLFIMILIRIILLVRASKQKEIAHEQLKSAYITAELELLKEQMNPHFLFNALSSLSGVIREDPQLAQKYVRELSNVFRYALVESGINLVAIEQELQMLQSFAQLVKMRLENAFVLVVDVDDQYLSCQIPHLSLQPLLENAVKHNAATISKPLMVNIFVQFDKLVVSNNLQEIPEPESSNGIGLANLNERFKIMMNNEIEISKTNEQFIVKLPLKA